MYSAWGVLVGIFFIWAGGLSFLIWQQNKFLRSVFPKNGERDIRKKFEEILGSILGFEERLADLEKKINELGIDGLKHIQKVELMRFNPYDDTGGDQSFAVALLDRNGTGVVVTSLHARSGTRVFAKGVIEGKPDKYQFSEEEKKIIKKVLNEK